MVSYLEIMTCFNCSQSSIFFNNVL